MSTLIQQLDEVRRFKQLGRDKTKDPVVKKRNVASLEMRDMRGAGEHEVKTKFSKKKRLRDKQNLRKEMDY